MRHEERHSDRLHDLRHEHAHGNELRQLITVRIGVEFTAHDSYCRGVYLLPTPRQAASQCNRTRSPATTGTRSSTLRNTPPSRHCPYSPPRTPPRHTPELHRRAPCTDRSGHVIAHVLPAFGELQLVEVNVRFSNCARRVPTPVARRRYPS